VQADDEAYLRDFFQALEEGPLEPTDKRYVPSTTTRRSSRTTR
jgi:hypothetical protein